MSLQENEIKIVDYLDGTLPPAEKAALEDHIRSCPECRNAVADARAGQISIQGLTLAGTPDLSRPILERISRMPRPGSPGSPGSQGGPLPLVPILLGAMLLLTVLVASMNPAPTRVNESPKVRQPAIATASVPLPNPPKPVTIFLAKAAGGWTSPETATTGAVPGGATFNTGEQGTLEFELAGTAPEQGLSQSARTRVILLPGSFASVDPDSFRLDSGSAWFQVRSGRHPKGFTVKSGGTRLEVTGTTFGVAATASGLQVALFEGTLTVHPASGTAFPMRAMDSVRVAVSETRLEALSETALRPWLPFLDDRLKILVAPLGKPPVTGSASPSRPLSSEPPATSTAKPATETGSPAAPGSENPIDTLLHHQPDQD